VLLGLSLLLLPSLAPAAVRYISSSAGNDNNNGLSSSTPWKTFNAVNALTLQPGDQVLLKGGDLWNQELNLRGVGTSTNPITLGTYGSGSANIHRTDLNNHRCVVINNASYWRISGLDCRNAKLGIYLRYENLSYSNDMQITYCYFKNIANKQLDPAPYNYEYGPSCGIWIGGKIHGAPFKTQPVLDNLLIQHCAFDTVDHGIGMNHYWWLEAPIYKSRFRNVQILDCVAVSCWQGLVHLNHVDGGSLRRTRSLYGGGYAVNGITAGFTQYCKNFTIDDNQFAYTRRDNCPDGVGWDFEGANENMTFSNNVLHDNDGGAVLTMAAQGLVNTNIQFLNNTMYNNAKNAETNVARAEMVFYNNGNTGALVNNGFYRGVAPTIYSPENQGFSKSGNRDLTLASLGPRYAAWEFNTTGNQEGWTGFNQWTHNGVSDGVLYGLSTGPDAFATVPTFCNTFDGRYIKVRMKQSAGNWGQFFYITDTDPVWNAAKSIAFPITPDYTFREYTVDLNTIDSKGVITGLRLDPTNATNSMMAIDYVRFAN
jgi:hypothetical protein